MKAIAVIVLALMLSGCSRSLCTPSEADMGKPRLMGVERMQEAMDSHLPWGQCLTCNKVVMWGDKGSSYMTTRGMIVGFYCGAACAEAGRVKWDAQEARIAASVERMEKR